jgi:hypothetical protein
MVLINPTSGSKVQSSRGNDVRVGNPERISTRSLATSMPSDRQTGVGVMKVDQSSETSGDYQKWKKSKLFHPKQSYSAITSENYLKAKAAFEPIFVHSIGATKLALMSVMDKEKPRFSEKLNILA